MQVRDFFIYDQHKEALATAAVPRSNLSGMVEPFAEVTNQQCVLVAGAH